MSDFTDAVEANSRAFTQMREQRDKARAAIDRLRGELGNVQGMANIAHAEIDRLRGEVAAMTAERDLWHTTWHGCDDDREALREAGDGLATELESLKWLPEFSSATDGALALAAWRKAKGGEAE